MEVEGNSQLELEAKIKARNRSRQDEQMREFHRVSAGCEALFLRVVEAG